MDDLIILKKADLAEVIREEFNKILECAKPSQLERKQTLTLDEAVVYLNESGFEIAKSSIYRLTSTNQIPFHRFGERKIIFRADELDSWVNSRIGNKEYAVAGNVARSARKKIY